MDKESPSLKVGSLDGHFLLGSLNDLRGDSLGFFDECSRHGDIVSFRIAYRRMYGLHHPDLVKEVLLTKHESFVKKGIYSRVRPVFRNGLVTSMGELWKRQRRSIQPVFTQRNMENMFATTAREIYRYRSELLEKADRGETVDVFKEMLFLTLGIMSATMFGDDVSEERELISEHIYFLNTFMKDSLYGLLPPLTFIPTRRNRRYREAMRTLDGITQRIVKKRREADDFGNDFLGMLLSSRDPKTGEGMSDRQVRDEALAFFIAGHETTAAGLSWTYYLLNEHRDARAELERCADAADLPDDSSELSFEQVKSNGFFERVFLESMRMYPPIYVTYREAAEDVDLGGVRVRKGESVYVCPYVLNRDARFWKDPQVFDPDRFLNSEAAKNRFLFLPFGVGPRNCIGSHFAMMEAQMVLAILGSSLRFETDEALRPVPEPLITLKPRDPLRMRVVRRTGSN